MRFLFVFLFSLLLVALPAQMQKKRGTVKMRHPNGKLMAKGKVRDYKKQGTWKFYYDKGGLASTMVYLNDSANGPYFEYTQDGKIKQQGNYCMAVKCGDWKHYDEAGHLISEENFSHGNPEGLQRFWYENGQIRDSVLFVNEAVNYRKAWYENGRVKTIETYANGVPEGTWVIYPDPAESKDTFPASKDEYHNGLRNGWHYAWKDGGLTEKFHYVNGLLDGEATLYAPDGRISSVTNFKEGLLDGTTVYFKDGKKIKVENYAYGQKNGEWEEYNRDEKVFKREWYSNDILDSTQSYYPNGKLAISTKGNAARGWVWWQYWDESGLYLMDGIEINDVRDGDWCTYYPNGNTRSCSKYDKGTIVHYTKNYPNGKPMISYDCSGEKTGNEQAWTESGKPIKKGTKQFDELLEGNRPGESLIDDTQFRRGILMRGDDQSSGNSGNVNFNFQPEDSQELVNPPSGDLDVPVTDTSEVFLFCDLPAEFPGGEQARNKFISEHIVDPRDAKDQREGTVWIEYVVEKDGTVTNVSVKKSLTNSPDLDRAAVAVVTLFPKHVPGKNNGQPVRSLQVIPIKFTLR